MERKREKGRGEEGGSGVGREVGVVGVNINIQQERLFTADSQ